MYHQSEPLTLHSVITRQANNLFLASPYCQLRHVRCKMEQGVLTLEGRLSTYYLKQLAQKLALQIPGVQAIANHLEVALPPARLGQPLSSPTLS